MQGGLTRYAKEAERDGRQQLPGRWLEGHLGTRTRRRRGMKTRSLASRQQRPLIGVTTSEVRARKSGSSRPPRASRRSNEMALGLPYLRGIEAAGGLPLVIPPLDTSAIEPLLDRLDGICLSGGPDLDPALYAPSRTRSSGRSSPTSTASSSTSPRRADAREMPILAICRGTQALNIVRGGALHQHLPDLSTRSPTARRNPGTEPSHPVAVVPGLASWPTMLGGGEHRADRRQLLPPPGDRPARRGPAGQRPRARRHGRGDRGPEPPLPDRRPVARRDARPPRLRGGALPPLRRACRDDGAEYERAAGGGREVA